jgi:hypothetical protein
LWQISSSVALGAFWGNISWSKIFLDSVYSKILLKYKTTEVANPLILQFLCPLIPKTNLHSSIIEVISINLSLDSIFSRWSNQLVIYHNFCYLGNSLSIIFNVTTKVQKFWNCLPLAGAIKWSQGYGDILRGYRYWDQGVTAAWVFCDPHTSLS